MEMIITTAKTNSGLAILSNGYMELTNSGLAILSNGYMELSRVVLSGRKLMKIDNLTGL